MTGRLEGKIAIVTGGASGFGSGIVDCFVREGASVLIADINMDAASRKAGELTSSGAKVAPCHVDVADKASVFAMAETCISTFGSVDIMVANAGVGQPPTGIEKITDELFDRVFDINVKGTLYSCQAVVPHFRAKGGGNILIISSGIVLRPRPNMGVYGASKAAVANLGKGLASELAGDKIRVNVLCPALGDTPLLSEFIGEDVTDTVRARLTEQLPLGKLITPKDVGESAVFLASEAESRNVTGSFLAIDGGRCI
jgi:3-oxoacyl-[acyl-carrier protein] reductase